MAKRVCAVALVFVQSHRNVQLGHIHGPPVASRFAASVAPAASFPLLALLLPFFPASSLALSVSPQFGFLRRFNRFLGLRQEVQCRVTRSNSTVGRWGHMSPREAVYPAHPPNGLPPAAAVRSRRAPTTQSWGEKWFRGNPCHICIGTRLTSATSAPGLGSPLPHLRRDWAHPCHICAGTGLTAATSAPGLGWAERQTRAAASGAC